VAGAVELSFHVDGHCLPSAPFQVVVSAGAADPARCEAGGAALDGLVAFSSRQLFVRLFDAFGNACTADGAVVEWFLSDAPLESASPKKAASKADKTASPKKPSRKKAASKADDTLPVAVGQRDRMTWQSDRYVADVCAEQPGKASLSIMVDGAHIAGSPWVLAILVRPATLCLTGEPSDRTKR
jgi:hypothetical protein